MANEKVVEGVSILATLALIELLEEKGILKREEVDSRVSAMMEGNDEQNN